MIGPYLKVNRLACLRLTERCAGVLISVREEVAEAGNHVGVELHRPIARLVEYVIMHSGSTTEVLRVDSGLSTRYIRSSSSRPIDRSSNGTSNETRYSGRWQIVTTNSTTL